MQRREENRLAGGPAYTAPVSIINMALLQSPADFGFFFLRQLIEAIQEGVILVFAQSLIDVCNDPGSHASP